MKQATVIKPHKQTYPHPILVIKGAEVTIIRQDDDAPGWLWCEDQTGLDGWIPKRYLDITGDSAVLNQDYDAIEMTVEKGETLAIVKSESGWAWCKKENNEEGWVPEYCLSAV